MKPTIEQIEQARMEKGVPEDWPYKPCAAGCGETVVFYPPGAEEAAKEANTPFVVVCTAECVETLMELLAQARISQN